MGYFKALSRCDKRSFSLVFQAGDVKVGYFFCFKFLELLELVGAARDGEFYIIPIFEN